MVAETPDLIIYYGMEAPPGIWKDESLVVLQEYHPMVVTGEIMNYFPASSLYIYWNPSRVPTVVAREQNLPIRGRDPHWNTSILDLSHARCRDFVLSKALDALSLPFIRGLFVDDLEGCLFHEEEISLVRNLIGTVQARTGRTMSWIANRAVALWSDLDGLVAGLVEGVDSESILSSGHDDLAWLETNILAPLERVRAERPWVHRFALGYEESASPRERVQGHDLVSLSLRRHRIGMRFFELIQKQYRLNRRLDEWPKLS